MGCQTHGGLIFGHPGSTGRLSFWTASGASFTNSTRRRVISGMRATAGMTLTRLPQGSRPTLECAPAAVLDDVLRSLSDFERLGLFAEEQVED